VVLLRGSTDRRRGGPQLNRPTDVLRFDGEICGFGTTSGVRVIVGRWPVSPFGSFADAMVEHPDGRRLLIAPSPAIADLVGAVYGFDEIVVGDVVASRTPDRLHIAGGPLRADVSIGGRDLLGRVLRLVPRRVATSATWARLVDPVARLTLRGVRTAGRTAGGRETYGATDRHRVVGVEATWEGCALGPLADVDPPVRFGFSSTPKRPSIVAVCTTIRPLT
jgi:hypothetical protein